VSVNHHLITQAISTCPGFQLLCSQISNHRKNSILDGIVGSASTAVVAALYEHFSTRTFVVVTPSPQSANNTVEDLKTLLDRDEHFLFPHRETIPYESNEPHLEIGGLQIEAVEALLRGQARLLVTTLRALQECAPIPLSITELRITLKTGDSPGFQNLIQDLENRGFTRVPLVEKSGQYAVRGGIIDIFSFGTIDPFRVEFWNDEIVSIRLFDIVNQLSKSLTDEVHILPVEFKKKQDEIAISPKSLLEFIPGDALIIKLGEENWSTEIKRTWNHVSHLYEELKIEGEAPDEPGNLFLDPEKIKDLLYRFTKVDLGPNSDNAIRISCTSLPTIDRNIRKLKKSLQSASSAGYKNLILCDNRSQCDRLEEILGGPNKIPPETHVLVGSLTTGFILECASPQLQIFTDHEIFQRPRRIRRTRKFQGNMALDSLSQLSPGDHVVHIEHGVGIFIGLERINIEGEEFESMAIKYAGEETLRVPVYRLDLIERWAGESGMTKPPALNRIGGKRWKNLKSQASKAIEKMTLELLELYAKRSTIQGFSYSPDTLWQKEMESSFLYEDTPDQRIAMEEVKRDMESPVPMDRLICGDVGYGKTEIAIRAAFKAIQDGKQVALMAPTTVLAEQHRYTFEERLANYPVKIGTLSRFRAPKEQKKLIQKLKTGEIDIVIGTHRLLSKDVEIAKLGLLIVDEEQRFGVRHKEILKQLRTSIDVLTLTATPIPRTLYLSLTGIRDLSLIQTPPRDRMPIITHSIPWSDQIIAESIQRELDRGGQAFFLHNLTADIREIKDQIQCLVPEARVDFAHGQMKPQNLDRIMRDFVNGGIDVLVCSSIIENGIDVPNANTLIVNHADHFGLSQLYQIRGRVGRSDRRAYCYLIVPDNLNEESLQRIQILEHYTELGSGYSIALRDMEIRGAGNILGGNQSGFTQAIGIDTYMHILEKTVKLLKDGKDEPEYPQPEITMSGSTYLPDEYVPYSEQKLHLYRRMSKISDIKEVDVFRKELEDRFGNLSDQAERLMDGIKLRIIGQKLGIEHILLREQEARINFRPTAIPNLTSLEGPLRDYQVEVEVKRIEPLSLTLHQIGSNMLASTLITALLTLLNNRSEMA